MIAAALETLLNTLRQPTVSEHDIEAAARAFLDAIPDAPPEQLEIALGSLAPILDSDDLTLAGYAALIIGTVLEHGYEGIAVSQPIIDRLRQVLTDCAAFANRCHQLLIERGTAEDDFAEAFDEVREEAAALLPGAASAWDALNLFWGPAVAVFSKSVAAREANRSLRELTEPIADYHEGAYWLDLILSTPIAEPLLVIEPDTQKGLQGVMTGIVDNFQLHTLLMDVFPSRRWFRRRRVARSIVDVATGNGPQQTDDSVIGVWNMYAWTAVGSELQLPTPSGSQSTPHWIWGEGRPRDIPTFEGQRVILLGKPAYTRSWPSQRTFAQLPAEITVTNVLGKKDVTAWLRKMAAAVR